MMWNGVMLLSLIDAIEGNLMISIGRRLCNYLDEVAVHPSGKSSRAAGEAVEVAAPR